MRKPVQVDQKVKMSEAIPLSFQHLLALVGGIIIPPTLLGLSPSTILLGCGLGTLLFIFITRNKVPAFLCSSFAFMGPLVVAKESTGMEGMLFGIVAAGFVYVVISLLIRIFGSNWIAKLLPPVVVGSVVIIIGLSSGMKAIGWAGFDPSSTYVLGLDPAMVSKWQIVSFTTLCVGILGTTKFKGVWSSIPILLAMIFGYILSIVMGVTPIESVTAAFQNGLFAVPEIITPKVSIEAALITMPIALVAIGEHIADITAIGAVSGKNFIKDPGLHRTLLGDGLATMLAGCIGSTPNTTYSENVGVMAITKVYSVQIMKTAAIVSILLSFFAPFSKLIMGVPSPVIGGVCIVLFGAIAISGFKLLIENKIDFTKNRNLIVCGVTLIIGLGHTTLPITIAGTTVELSAIAIATFAGIILNIILPEREK